MCLVDNALIEEYNSKEDFDERERGIRGRLMYQETENKFIRKVVLFALVVLLIIFAFMLKNEISNSSNVKISNETKTSKGSNQEENQNNMFAFTKEPPAYPDNNEAENIQNDLSTEMLTEIPTEVPTPRPPPTERPTEVKTLRKGMKGEEVRLMQQRLVELRYLKEGDVDGNYGRGTVNAVKRFQQSNGLAPDGAAGRETLKKLFSNDAR